MKKIVTVGLAAVALVLSLSACNIPNPCATLPPSTPQELAIVATGAEVEREVNGGTECDLVDGVWTRETS